MGRGGRAGLADIACFSGMDPPTLGPLIIPAQVGGLNHGFVSCDFVLDFAAICSIIARNLAFLTLRQPTRSGNLLDTRGTLCGFMRA